MAFHKKVTSWLVDYAFMLRGALSAVIYRNPPRHYLGLTLEGKVPVILVPGILGRWSFMKKLGDAISLSGHPVYIVPGLGYNIYSIPSSAKILRSVVVHILPKRGHILPRVSKGAESIRKVIEEKNLRGAVLVAHSKGGLIGKYLLAHYNNDRCVLGMIAIAAPFSGSALAKFIPLEPLKELANDSKIIRDLEGETETNNRIISIIPEYDNHVWADSGSRLHGAENILVPVHGHHKVIFDKEVQALILRSIEKIVLKFGGAAPS